MVPCKDLKNFTEKWNIENELASLRTTQLYEASGSMLWSDPLAQKFNGGEIPRPQITWDKLFQCEKRWNETALEASAEETQFRRFHFPNCFLTAM